MLDATRVSCRHAFCVIGADVGQEAAAAVLALRASDGADTTLLDFGFPQGDEPGEWIFTPGVPFAFALDGPR